MFQQTILLQASLPDGYSFDSFYPGEQNQDCLTDLYCLHEQQEHRQVVIWGSENSGKSHILQAVCQRTYLSGQRASYYPLKKLFDYGPGMLEGYQSSHLLAIDDLDAIVKSREWELALFNLINQTRIDGQILLFSSTENPRKLDWALNDLASRLIWGTTYPIYTLTDEEKSQALQYRAKQRGFSIPETVVNFILKHYPRDFDSLLSLLDKLDKESLSQQHKITIPFVKKVLDIDVSDKVENDESE